jgi:hypothetical protein
MRPVVLTIAMACLPSVASAAYIPYYRMESLAFLASDVVLGDEFEYVEKKSKADASGYQATTYEFKVNVVRTLKGSCQPGEQIVVELHSQYTRRLADPLTATNTSFRSRCFVRKNNARPNGMRVR